MFVYSLHTEFHMKKNYLLVLIGFRYTQKLHRTCLSYSLRKRGRSFLDFVNKKDSLVSSPPNPKEMTVKYFLPLLCYRIIIIQDSSDFFFL